MFPGQREIKSDSGPDSLKDCAAFAAAKSANERKTQCAIPKAGAKGEMQANCTQTALPPLQLRLSHLHACKLGNIHTVGAKLPPSSANKPQSKQHLTHREQR